MEDKQSAPTNLELTKDQLKTKDSCGDELQSDGDSDEKQVEGNGFVTQLGDNQSLSSEDSSKNDGLRSKIPRVNCPEHIILCLDLSAEMKSTSFQNKTVLDRQENVTLPHVEDISLPPPYVVRVIIVYGRSYCIPRMSTRAKEIFSQLSACPYFFLDVLYVHELPSEMNRCKEIYDFFCDMDEEEDGFMLEVSRSTTRLFDHMAALVAHPLQRPKQRDTSYTLTLRED
ncbi:BRISC and BRCA1-A complex member 1 [Stylophora pistillata]|uniref:BRISC and BRCA1-A complex member 1 n=1 Tax=Stylophora pistillata TaxID=50429 RepID=A0A2B4S5Z0_STYPI|nr:BRISC and BRCA1-A complex member 1 [Stylophora pistillata]